MSDKPRAEPAIEAKIARQAEEEDDEDECVGEVQSISAEASGSATAGATTSSSASAFAFGSRAENVLASAAPLPDGEDPAEIVDVRPAADFLARHLRGSVSFELASLGVGGGDGTRATELPSRSWSVLLGVVGRDAEETTKGVEWLETRGWRVNKEKTFAADALNWPELEAKGLARSGRTLSRFWRASPPLEKGLRPIIEAGLPVDLKEKWALDLGCGSGRDAVFLAQRGWHVLAVDREESFIGKLTNFAQREGVGHLIHTQVADLRPQNLNRTLGDILTDRKFDLIHMSRFMNRPLLGFLAHNLPKASFFVIHHFLVGAQSRHGRPFRKGSEQTLESGELVKDWFKKEDFEILLDDESALPDGRPVTNFICRRA